MEFIRGVLALMCLFFGHMGGRSAAAVALGRQKMPRLVTWILRMVLCSAALAIRHAIDAIVIAVWALELAVFAAGYWMVLHQKPPEDLTREIFPE
jgi:uncharacterized membrane protein